MTESPHSPAAPDTVDAAVPAGPAAQDASTPITELLDASRFGGLVAARSGGPVFATVSELDSAGTGRVTRIVQLDEESTSTLTRGPASVGSVAAAASGALVFTSKRTGEDGSEAQDAGLWILPVRGEARRLAERPGGFGSVVLAAEDTVLVAEVGVHTHASSEEEHAELAKARTEAKVSGILHAGFPTRYWDHDLGPFRQTLAVARCASPDPGAVSAPLSTPAARSIPEAPAPLSFAYPAMPDGRLTGWSVAPNGTFAVVEVEVPAPGALQTSQLWKVDLTEACAAPVLLLAGDLEYDWSVGEVSPDSIRVLATRTRRRNPTTTLRQDLFVLEVGGADGTAGAPAPVWEKGDRWFSATWFDEATLVATSDDLGRGAVWTGAITDEEPRRLTGGPGQRFHYAGLVVTGGRVLAGASAVDVPPFPVEIDPGTGEVTPLTNPATELTAPGSMHEVVATGKDGTAVRAWLRVPEGEGPHPLLVMVHGGPWGSWNAWTWRWNPNPFVAAGFAVLLPDPAISTGYGQDMIDRGELELGGAPYTDILALVDQTVARPDIDEERTALAGGSYGGYMANWMAGHTKNRFRCIVTHASLWNVDSMGRTTDNESWEAAMREQIAVYSPHRFASAIEVPMLVIHGDRDYRVPISQGHELWFDLLTKSATPLAADGSTQHRYLYFPDEGHWILGRGNAQVWYEAVLGFVNEKVNGETWEKPATLG